MFRKYLYLDTDTVHDYASGLSSGTIEELTEINRRGLGKEATPDDKSHAEEEVVRESTMRITARHLFNQIHTEASTYTKTFDEEEVFPYEEIKRRDLVEVTRVFTPSEMNKMVDSIFTLLNQMQHLGFTEEVSDPDFQMGLRAMAMIFRGDNGEEEIPMVSTREDDTAIVFLAKTKFMIGPREDFSGDMTVFGTVKKKIPEGQHIDLFDFLKLPRAMRGEAQLKEELFSAFESWPTELGGPIDRKKTEIPGPAIILAPVAVYEA